MSMKIWDKTLALHYLILYKSSSRRYYTTCKSNAKVKHQQKEFYVSPSRPPLFYSQKRNAH